MMSAWEPVIGLEIHVQLKTRTKMFCRCANGFGGEPEHADLPRLPRLPGCAARAEPRGDRADDQARARARLRRSPTARSSTGRTTSIRTTRRRTRSPSTTSRSARAAAWSCRRPTARSRSGSSVPTSRRTQPRTSTSRPRAGSTARRRRSSTSTAAARPLLEIVTGPDLHSSDDAKRFLQLLRQTVVELGLSDAELEKGSMRFDVNVSVRPSGSGRATHANRAEEHELVQLRRQGDRAGDCAAGQDLRGRAARSSRRRCTSIPRTRTRRRCGARRRRRTTATSRSPTSSRSSRPPSSSRSCAPRSRELPSERIRRIAETLSFYDADVLVTGGLDRLWSPIVGAGADAKETANVLANAFVAAGVDPGARRSGRAREARRRPRGDPARRLRRGARALRRRGLLGGSLPRAEGRVATSASSIP